MPRIATVIGPPSPAARGGRSQRPKPRLTRLAAALCLARPFRRRPRPLLSRDPQRDGGPPGPRGVDVRSEPRPARGDAGALPAEGARAGRGERGAGLTDAKGGGRARQTFKGPCARGLGRARLRVRARLSGVGPEAWQLRAPGRLVGALLLPALPRGLPGPGPGRTRRAVRGGGAPAGSALPGPWAAREAGPGTLPGRPARARVPAARRPRPGAGTGAGEPGAGPPEARRGRPRAWRLRRARTPAVAGPSGSSASRERPHGPANGSWAVCGGLGRAEGPTAPRASRPSASAGGGARRAGLPSRDGDRAPARPVW